MLALRFTLLPDLQFMPANSLESPSVLEEYDAIVIGGGSAGVRFARMAAAAGARVAIIDARALGGTCVNEGCIPKKLMSYAAAFGLDARRAQRMGWDVSAAFSWTAFRRNMQAEVQRLNKVYASTVEAAGAQWIIGWAKFVDNRTVQVNGRLLRSSTIVIATGAQPAIPVVSGAEYFSTSATVFELLHLPQRVAIVGGGYIACELASILNGLGSTVHLVHRGDSLLRGFDADCSATLCTSLRRQGVVVALAQTVESITKLAGGLMVRLSSGEMYGVDMAIAATGRCGNTAALQLQNAGVSVNEDGIIETDDEHRTGVQGIFALGDVAARIQLTPTATRTAERLAAALFGSKGKANSKLLAAPNVWSVPTAVFTHPALAAAGMTEAQAVAAGYKVVVYSSQFVPLRERLLAHDPADAESALCKLVVDAQTERVLGVHVVGDDAAELIQGFAVAVAAGLSKSEFDNTLGLHPTVAEELVTLRKPRDVSTR